MRTRLVSGRSRRLGKGGAERGAVAVEAALVTPLLLVLIFGIIEFSFALRDYVSVSSAVRVGARIASTGAGAGPGSCADTNIDAADTVTGCAPTTTPALAQYAADAIQRSGSAMPKDSIDYILVYRANDKGYPGSDGSTTMPTSCAGYADCVRYTWKAASDAFRYAGGTWASASISACFPTHVDRVGVDMHATHKFMTGMFGAQIPLADHAVMDFEPLPTESCSPTAPQPHQ